MGGRCSRNSGGQNPRSPIPDPRLNLGGGFMRKNQENGKKMSKICSFAHCEKNRDPPLKAQGVNLVRACESLLRAYEVLCCGSAQYIEYTHCFLQGLLCV